MDTQQAVQELKAERVQEELMATGMGEEGLCRVAIELLTPKIVITVHGTKAGGGADGASPATTAGESR